ncbi:nitrile hydratase accessory protein [Dactylosporangium sp. CA-233914]|uniref:nitrile hydratase accessory protein n=1 Tax=Dactylosporangium sp. CA-233914 TaxID=3239934 RepID=UPI003D93D234
MTAALEVEGKAAPPRANGELVFTEPWESRAFGLAMTLNQSGAFDWEDFRQRLIAQISDWESSHEPGECFSYYHCWLDALEQIVVAQKLVRAGAVHARAVDLAARPAGWDHNHDHADQLPREHSKRRAHPERTTGRVP